MTERKRWILTVEVQQELTPADWAKLKALEGREFDIDDGEGILIVEVTKA